MYRSGQDQSILKIRVDRPFPDVIRLSLEGELDAVSREELLNHYDEWTLAGFSHFIIDLSEVTYIDSGGIGSLIDLFKRQVKRRGGFVLYGVNPVVSKVFHVTRITRFLNIVKSEREALARCREPARSILT